MKIFLISHEEKTAYEDMATWLMNAQINMGQLQECISDVYFVHESQNSTFPDFTISSCLPHFSFIFNEECMKTYCVDVLNYFVLYFIKRKICTPCASGQNIKLHRFTLFFVKAVVYWAFIWNYLTIPYINLSSGCWNSWIIHMFDTVRWVNIIEVNCCSDLCIFCEITFFLWASCIYSHAEN